MGILMQNHKCNEVENAFPILKVSRLVAQLAERRFLAGELTLSCARPAADG